VPIRTHSRGAQAAEPPTPGGCTEAEPPNVFARLPSSLVVGFPCAALQMKQQRDPEAIFTSAPPAEELIELAETGAARLVGLRRFSPHRPMESRAGVGLQPLANAERFLVHDGPAVTKYPCWGWIRAGRRAEVNSTVRVGGKEAAAAATTKSLLRLDFCRTGKPTEWQSGQPARCYACGCRVCPALAGWALSICYDVRFTGAYSPLAGAGAELVMIKPPSRLRQGYAVDGAARAIETTLRVPPSADRCTWRRTTWAALVIASWGMCGWLTLECRFGLAVAPSILAMARVGQIELTTLSLRLYCSLEDVFMTLLGQLRRSCWR